MDENSNQGSFESSQDSQDQGIESTSPDAPDGQENGTAPENFNDPDPHGFGPDKEGGYFDPEIHAVDDKGLPWKTIKKGTWAKRRGIRKAPKDKINIGPSPDEKMSKFILSQEKDKELEAFSSAITDLTIMGALIIGGEAYQPKVDKDTGLDQRAMLVQGWKGYLKDTDWAKEKIPGWAGLALGYGYYLLPPVVTQPTVKQRVKNFGKKAWDFITLKWIWGKKDGQGTDVDSGEKRVRQDVVGKK